MRRVLLTDELAAPRSDRASLRTDLARERSASLLPVRERGVYQATGLWAESGEDEQCRAECPARYRSVLVQGRRTGGERSAWTRC